LESLEDNIVLPVIKTQLKKDASSTWWHERSLEQKIQYVRGCIAPFRASDERIQHLIKEAESSPDKP
jgi:hypothetical protein